MKKIKIFVIDSKNERTEYWSKEFWHQECDKLNIEISLQKNNQNISQFIQKLHSGKLIEISNVSVGKLLVLIHISDIIRRNDELVSKMDNWKETWSAHYQREPIAFVFISGGEEESKIKIIKNIIPDGELDKTHFFLTNISDKDETLNILCNGIKDWFNEGKFNIRVEQLKISSSLLSILSLGYILANIRIEDKDNTPEIHKVFELFGLLENAIDEKIINNLTLKKDKINNDDYWTKSLGDISNFKKIFMDEYSLDQLPTHVEELLNSIGKSKSDKLNKKKFLKLVATSLEELYLLDNK